MVEIDAALNSLWRTILCITHSGNKVILASMWMPVNLQVKILSTVVADGDLINVVAMLMKEVSISDY